MSGPQGTELIEKLAGQAASRLRPGGRLIVELSPMIADACQEIVAQTGCYEDIKFVKDLAGHRRILSCQRALDNHLSRIAEPWRSMRDDDAKLHRCVIID